MGGKIEQSGIEGRYLTWGEEKKEKNKKSEARHLIWGTLRWGEAGNEGVESDLGF